MIPFLCALPFDSFIHSFGYWLDVFVFISLASTSVSVEARKNPLHTDLQCSTDIVVVFLVISMTIKWHCHRRHRHHRCVVTRCAFVVFIVASVRVCVCIFCIHCVRSFIHCSFFDFHCLGWRLYASFTHTYIKFNSYNLFIYLSFQILSSHSNGLLLPIFKQEKNKRHKHFDSHILLPLYFYTAVLQTTGRCSSGWFFEIAF